MARPAPSAGNASETQSRLPERVPENPKLRWVPRARGPCSGPAGHTLRSTAPRRLRSRAPAGPPEIWTRLTCRPRKLVLVRSSVLRHPAVRPQLSLMPATLHHLLLMSTVLPSGLLGQAEGAIRSSLRTVDIGSGRIETIYTDDRHFEAPNWSRDGRPVRRLEVAIVGVNRLDPPRANIH